MTPKLQPYEHEGWKYEVQSLYPRAYFQDDSNPSALRERALNLGKLIGFYMCPHATQKGSGYVVQPPEPIDGA